MRAVVTGAAGFIGSHLCDRLLADGHEVFGIDCFRGDYSRGLKELNLAKARSSPRFSFGEIDLLVNDLAGALEGADVVFHMSGRSGLGTSNDTEFGEFVSDNIVATQRLLEAALMRTPAPRLVYGGSSSIYGDAERFPTKETAVPTPRSAYGVTKLAGESLVYLYGRSFGLPVTVLRYFTVFGPRQRPDMAVSQFMRALAEGHEIEIFGDGTQTRDFTYIDDAIEATVRAATEPAEGEVINIGGGSRTSINNVVAMLEEITGRITVHRHLQPSPADQRHSCASINVARRRLAWEPRISVRNGLVRQWAWFQSQQEHRPAFKREAVAV